MQNPPTLGRAVAAEDRPADWDDLLEPEWKVEIEVEAECARCNTYFASFVPFGKRTDSVMIGLSARTDEAGANGLMDQLKKLGHKATIVNTPKGVLHFKTACSLLDEETILVTRQMSESGLFKGFRNMILPKGEEPAANALRINNTVLISARYKRTIDMLDQAGYWVVPVKTAEIEKIDAGLSCMSLRWFSQK